MEFDINLSETDEIEHYRKLVKNLEKIKKQKEDLKSDYEQDLALQYSTLNNLKSEIESYIKLKEKLAKLQAKLEESKNTIKIKKKKTVVKHIEVIKPVCEECENLLDDIQLKKADIEKIQNDISVVELSHKDNLHTLPELKEKLELMKENYEQLKDSEKNDTNEATTLIEELEEEKMILISKLAVLKSGQEKDDASSLFNEVEKERQKLLDDVKQLRNKNKDFESQLDHLNIQNSKLKETVRLLQENDIDPNDIKEIERTKIENHEMINSVLKSLISHYEKRPEKPNYITISDETNDLNFVNPIISNTRKDAAYLKEIHMRINMALMNLEKKMCVAKNESSALKKELKKYTKNLEALKSQLLQIQASQTEENSSNVVPKKGVRFAELAVVKFEP